MTTSRWYVAALALVCIASSSARAQTVAQAGDTASVVSCERNPSAPGAWSHCNLSMDANTLKRGEQGELLARRRFMRPIAIAQFVSGDSAMRYARAYHRSEMVHGTVAFAAAGAIVASIMAGHACLRDLCRKSSGGLSARTLGIVGLSLVPLSIGLKIHTNRLAKKSLDFYNALLAH